MAIAFALACALVYGAADFLGGVAARRVSAVAVVVWSQTVGLAVLLAAMPFLGGSPHLPDLLWGVACGCAGGFAVALLYRALAIGTMGVISPMAAAVPVAFGIARGERPATLAVFGIGFAMLAVVMVSAATPRPTTEDADAPLARREQPRRFPPGIPEAIWAGIAFGFLFIGLSQTRAEAGLFPMLTMRLTSLSLLVGSGLVLRQPMRVSRPSFRTIAFAGALDMIANVLFVIASHSGGSLSVVAVAASLYPAGTVALAAIVLRERLVRVQWAGVAIAFAGVVCMSLAR